MDFSGLTYVMAEKIRRNLKKNFAEFSGDIFNIIMDRYNNLISDVDYNSIVHASKLNDVLHNRLKDFEYVISDSTDMVSIQCPDKDNFDFSGILRILEVVVNGLQGNYLEISADDYLKIFGTNMMNTAPVDITENIDDTVFLIKDDNNARRIEHILNKKLITFPFSNTSPINIFEDGEQLVDKNIESIISKSIEDSMGSDEEIS